MDQFFDAEAGAKISLFSPTPPEKKCDKLQSREQQQRQHPLPAYYNSLVNRHHHLPEQ